MKNIRHLLVVSATFLTTGVMAQQSDVPRVTPFSGVDDYRTWSVGVWGAASTAWHPFGNYSFGNFDLSNVNGLYGINIKKQIYHGFGLQADFMRGDIGGSVKDNQNELQAPPVITSTPTGYVENYTLVSKFNTHIDWAASLSGVFTLGTINWLNRQATVLPYISAGGGYMGFHAQVETLTNGSSYVNKNGEMVSAKPSASKAFYIPVGVGAKFNVATGINIDLGYRVNFVNSKYFDGAIGNGMNDKFSSVRLGVEFALGNKRKPQLAVVNPAAQLAMDLWDRNQDLKNQLDDAKHQQQEYAQNTQQQIESLKKDSDGDGVPDIHDKCPGTAPGLRVDGAGCPLPQPKQIIKQEKVVVTQEDRKVVAEAIKNLEFDLGKAIIRPESYESLDQVAELLINKNFSLKLAGNTDNTGNFDLNMRLSRERAEAVKTYLVSKGANPSRIEAVGYGSTQPIASNDTPEGRQENRRVEFTLY